MIPGSTQADNTLNQYIWESSSSIIKQYNLHESLAKPTTVVALFTRGLLLHFLIDYVLDCVACCTGEIYSLHKSSLPGTVPKSFYISRRKFRSQISDVKFQQVVRKTRTKTMSWVLDVCAWQIVTDWNYAKCSLNSYMRRDGPKVGSVNRWMRKSVEKAWCKNGTPLWLEAHLEVKLGTTVTPRALLEGQMLKSARSCGRKRIWESKAYIKGQSSIEIDRDRHI